MTSMSIHISSMFPHGTLCLQDVINRLSFLRGHGTANMYSWSTKRNYRNGFVWRDLSENDLIYPSSSHEYVLKGTQLIEALDPMKQYYQCQAPKVPMKQTILAWMLLTPLLPPRRARSVITRQKHIVSLLRKRLMLRLMHTDEKGRQRMEMEQGEGFDKNGGSNLSFSRYSFGSLEGYVFGISRYQKPKDRK